EDRHIGVLGHGGTQQRICGYAPCSRLCLGYLGHGAHLLQLWALRTSVGRRTGNPGAQQRAWLKLPRRYPRSDLQEDLKGSWHGTGWGTASRKSPGETAPSVPLAVLSAQVARMVH